MAADVIVSEAEARAVLERIDARHPGRVRDVAAFAPRWRKDQAACEREVKAAPAAGPRPTA